MNFLVKSGRTHREASGLEKVSLLTAAAPQAWLGGRGGPFPAAFSKRRRCCVQDPAVLPDLRGGLLGLLLTQVFQGMLRAHKDFHDTKASLTRLWIHECFR